MLYIIIFCFILASIFWFKNRNLSFRQAIKSEQKEFQEKFLFTISLAKVVLVLILVVLIFIATALVIERVI